MRLFIKKIIIISVGFYLFAEILARLLHISTDAPRLYQNSKGVIKYYKNQEGYWENASHKWYINEFGFPGKNSPNSFDNLITIIGPSVISNFMNPDSCRQMEILKKVKPEYDYLELSRPGSNLLDYFDFIEDIDSLKPKINLMYVIDKSFTKSIKKESGAASGTQLDLKHLTIHRAEFQESTLKNILYNFKFAYYLYRKNIHIFDNFNTVFGKKKLKRKFSTKYSAIEINRISVLLDFVKNNYRIDNVVLLFNDRNHTQIFDLVKSKGFHAFRFNSAGDDWTFIDDTHWTCYGHEQAAIQVSEFLDQFTEKYNSD